VWAATSVIAVSDNAPTPVRRLAFSTLGVPDLDATGVARLAADNGYDAVELRFLDGSVELPTLDSLSPEHIEQTRSIFDAAGVAVLGISSSVTLIKPGEADHRAASLDLARANLRLAAGLGATQLRVFGGTPDPADDRAAVLREAAALVNEIAELTAASGVTTLIETHDAFCTAKAMGELFEAGVGDAAQVLWDSGHSWRHGETLQETWDLLGPRVRHVHVKDATAADADGMDLVLTGEGIFDIPALLGVLDAGGYDGYLSFEWEWAWHRDLPSGEIAIPHFARYLRGLTE